MPDTRVNLWESTCLINWLLISVYVNLKITIWTESIPVSNSFDRFIRLREYDRSRSFSSSSKIYSTINIISRWYFCNDCCPTSRFELNWKIKFYSFVLNNNYCETVHQFIWSIGFWMHWLTDNHNNLHSFIVIETINNHHLLRSSLYCHRWWFYHISQQQQSIEGRAWNTISLLFPVFAEWNRNRDKQFCLSS